METVWTYVTYGQRFASQRPPKKNFQLPRSINFDFLLAGQPKFSHHDKIYPELTHRLYSTIIFVFVLDFFNASVLNLFVYFEFASSIIIIFIASWHISAQNVEYCKTLQVSVLDCQLQYHGSENTFLSLFGTSSFSLILITTVIW